METPEGKPRGTGFVEMVTAEGLKLLLELDDTVRAAACCVVLCSSFVVLYYLRVCVALLSLLCVCSAFGWRLQELFGYGRKVGVDIADPARNSSRGDRKRT